MAKAATSDPIGRSRSVDPAPLPDVTLLVALWVLEFALVATLVGNHRLGERSLVRHMSSMPGMATILGSIIGAASAGLITVRLWSANELAIRQRRLALAVNLLTVSALFIICETGVRVLAVRDGAETTVAGVNLLPRSWERTVGHFKALVADREGSFIVADPELGWVPLAGGQSRDGLYAISPEGIRSPDPLFSYSRHFKGIRVAMVGDSYTFGNGVPYEDSWGYSLQAILGPGFQVLNFGVGAYGIDQSYLRYKRDVRPWNPHLVILGAFPHDTTRVMTAYPFLTFPTWRIPFSKPRFAIRGNRLVNLNPTPPSVEVILSSKSVHDLPLVSHSRGFFPANWERHFYHSSYLIRLVSSRFAPLHEEAPQNSLEEEERINAEILRSFVRDVKADGALPMVLYLPARRDMNTDHNPGRRIIRQSGMVQLDLTALIRSVESSQRWAETGTHYSGRSNRKLAELLAVRVLQLFPQALCGRVRRQLKVTACS